jgi:hypothetical protein
MLKDEMTAKPDMPFRFSPAAEHILAKAGWTPSRWEDPGSVIELLRRDGWPYWQDLDGILGNLGGLEVRPPARWDVPMSPMRFSFNPDTLEGESDRLPVWQSKAGVPLFPLGEAYGPHWLLLGKDGRVFVGNSVGGLDELGQTLVEAIEVLTLGTGRPRQL